MKLAYWYSHSFADDISLEIVRRITGLPSVEGVNLCVESDPRIPATPKLRSYARIIGRLSRKLGIQQARIKPAREPMLFGLGSIFMQVKANDIVWGSGINPKWQPRSKLGYPIDIRAVRGPLTRKFIVEELQAGCPQVYGDPALLMPLLFPEYRRNEDPRYEYTVLLQHNDEPFIQSNIKQFENHHVVPCQRIGRWPWQKVVQLILDSRYIISSSLHGIIIAETFGIPARWWHCPELPSSYTEHTMKFNDYFLSTGRKPNQFVSSIEEALTLGPLIPINGFDPRPLVQAFPYELFPGAKPPLNLSL